MRISIQSFDAISPIAGFATNHVVLTAPQPVDGFLKCIEPDYKYFINAKLLRRMSRVIKMGVATAHQTLQKGGISQPDAILIGTGLGCVDDTIVFLDQLTVNNESLLNPTAFIQSTHNTVSGQIALLLECKSYNLTFTQQQLSFESALLEALMLLEEHPHKKILVGGIDEMTPQLAQLLVKSGCATDTSKPGYTPGEGAAFFVLDTETTSVGPSIVGFDIRHDMETPNDRAEHVEWFLKKGGIQIEDLGLVLMGTNGSPADSADYGYLSDARFAGVSTMPYKKYCGEHDSSSAFALWLACAIGNGSVEDFKMVDHKPYLLIHNKGKSGGDVLILVQK